MQVAHNSARSKQLAQVVERPWLRHAGATALLAVLVCACLAVFALYTQPEFLITLANMAWTCF
ncbi:MAG: hypothetical protein ACKVIH_03305 [Burkholderiales bacterium]